MINSVFPLYREFNYYFKFYFAILVSNLSKVKSFFMSQHNRITVVPANKKEDRQILFNLSQFYQHDISSFFELSIDHLPHLNGLYKALPYFDLYWQETERFPFLFLYSGKPIGFALVNTIGTSPDVNWNMAEFFIIKACRRKGFGRQTAKKIIEQFHGIWEIAVIPENSQALCFWEKTIRSLFPHEIPKPILKIIQKPKARSMKIFKMKS